MVGTRSPIEDPILGYQVFEEEERWPLWKSAALTIAASGLLWVGIIGAVLLVV